MAAPTLSSWLSMRKGASKAASSFWATMLACSRRAMSNSATTNSSPPSRATTSSVRSDLAQPAADLLQQAVADAVAQRVVDRLEAVQVDEQHAPCWRLRRASDSAWSTSL